MDRMVAGAAAAGLAVGLGLGVYLTRKREVSRKRTILTATVRADRAELYKRHHAGVWPEVQDGLAAAGVETISIWSDPTDPQRLYMYLEEIEGGANTGPGSAYRAASERVKEWESKMETEFHAGWTACNEWYTLKSCGSRRVALSTNTKPPCYDIMCTSCCKD